MKQKSILVTFLFFSLLEIFSFWRPIGKIFWIYLIGSCLILIGIILWSIGLQFKKWFSLEIITHSIYLLLPILFYLANLFFLLLIQTVFFRQIFLLVNTVLCLMILMGMRGIILNLEQNIKPRLTYNFLVLSTIWTGFLLYSVILAFYRDLNLSIWLIISFFFLINILLYYQILHLFGALKRRALIYSLVIALILSEIVWVLCFWPLEYFYSGLLLTIVSYIFWGVSHHQLENTLTRKLILEYLIIGIIIFILIFRRSIIALGFRGY